MDCEHKKATWGEEDENYDLGLEKFSVDMDALNQATVAPRRRFRCFLEDWEDVKDKHAVMRAKLLRKYGGLVFDDIDDTDNVRLTVSTTMMKWIRSSGWHVIAEPAEYDGTNDDVLEPFPINEETLIYLIKNTEQPTVLNVRMVNKEDGEEDSDDEGSDAGRNGNSASDAAAN